MLLECSLENWKDVHFDLDWYCANGLKQPSPICAMSKPLLFWGFLNLPWPRHQEKRTWTLDELWSKPNVATEAPSFWDRSFLVQGKVEKNCQVIYAKVESPTSRERYVSINNKTPSCPAVAGVVGGASESAFFGSHGGDFTDASIERQLLRTFWARLGKWCFWARFVAQVLLWAIKPRTDQHSFVESKYAIWWQVLE